MKKVENSVLCGMWPKLTKPLSREWKDRIKRSFLYRGGKQLLHFLYYPIAVLLCWRGIRIIRITSPDRIGHLCLEPDCFIKEGKLGLRPQFRGVLLAPRTKIANTVVLDLWKQCMPVISSALGCRLMYPLLSFPFATYSLEHYAVAINDTAACGKILARWGSRPALLKKEWVGSQPGWETLRRLGMPDGNWYVCVHSRDGHYSPADEHLHSYRNSSIENYYLAMQAIVKRGGWCVRVGDPGPSTMPPMQGVIDYANSPLKSDWMDVFLCANCRFFLGNSSGLYLLSTVFGVHSALANLIPVSGALPVGRGDIGIPKHLRSRTSGKRLGFTEILNSPIGNFRFASQYEAEQIAVEENTPEEICDLAIEMLERLSGAGPDSRPDEDLQQRFHELIKPGHYSYGADSRIGRDFLRKYSPLL